MVRIAMPVSRVNSALWGEGITPFPSDSLEKRQFDIAIIGGGFSALWSAFHLKRLSPDLNIALFEASEIGFGASGRNGGWASTDYPVSKSTLQKRHGIGKSELLARKLSESIDEIGDFAAKFSPSAAFTKSGTISFARNRAQLARLKSSLDHGSSFLNADELRTRIRINGALAGVYNPNSATVSPLQLLYGLAQRVRELGVSIFTNCRATPIDGGVLAGSHMVRSELVIAATEAFGTAKREFIPLYSLMVATEPLPDSFWDEIGNKERFTFAENSHLINYAQRTADNRIAIGGRGATYPFGSRLQSAKESTESVHEHIRNLARSWFPALGRHQFTHAWGGAVAITRDWEPYVIWDRERRLGRLGGYAGDGVTMSYLAAKCLANEILQREDESRDLHFIGRRIRRWEPEPLRYLAINSLVKLSGIADQEEAFSGRPSILDRVIAPLILR